jgi:hypothetical protein
MIRGRARQLLFFLVILVSTGVPPRLFAQAFLSNLSADANQPIFFTYAAATSRSQFILDQGYQFQCNDPGSGLSFRTSGGGSFNLAAKLNDSLSYSLGTCFRGPILMTSYSDLVRYNYYPFAGLRVDVSFLVYSSRVAVQDIRVSNERATAVDLDLYPFTANPLNLFSSAAVAGGGKGISYRHSVPPDWWEVEHGQPHAIDRADLFLLDTVAFSYGGYFDVGQSGSPRPAPSGVGANYCVEYGLVYHSDGSLCTHPSSAVRQVVYLNKNKAQILTENAPKWGDVDPNVPGNGYQGCELGNFSKTPIAAGDSFTVVFSCETRHELGQAAGVAASLPAGGGIYVEVHLQPTGIPTPANVTVQFSTRRDASLVQWSVEPSVHYAVYRRAQAAAGIFDRIADEIQGGGYGDSGLDSSTAYIYTVLPSNSAGVVGGHSRETGFGASTLMEAIRNPELGNIIPAGTASVYALQRRFHLAPGESRRMRVAGGVIEADSTLSNLVAQCEQALGLDIDALAAEDESAYASIPDLPSQDPETRLLYWNAFSLLRQCFLPPEGKCHFPYYVFSREPQWGWGHGGQVFHESLSMLAYVLMDPVGAQNSQRVFRERQLADGYINYRTGPYLDETILTNGQMTTSAPWYSWTNLELYKISRDRDFLEEMFASGKKLYAFFDSSRDADRDGLYEWGGHAVLESVRDGEIVIWDNVGWPSNFECLDLSSMLCSEAQSLAEMAGELGNRAEELFWSVRANALKDSINKYMWDEETGFYYHVGKNSRSFSYSVPNDLKRKEIIGFLPLWSGIATPRQAALLVKHLTDTSEFWRPYGVPGLAADDPYYNPQGYWNGPVWVQWQYLIFRGLLRYGYVEEAKKLANRVVSNMTYSLKTNHEFWELYSPDSHWSGWNKTYIWAGIAARMLYDLQSLGTGIIGERSLRTPSAIRLEQNYPNPFNPSTTISYQISDSKYLKMSVYDLLGREVAVLVDGLQSAGEHRVVWIAAGLSSGTYICRLRAGSETTSMKMILIR